MFLSSVGQIEENVMFPNNIAMSFKLPTPMANRGFRNAMAGVGNIDLNYQYKLNEKLYLGLGTKYQIFELLSANFSYSIAGDMQAIGAFGKVGAEFQANDKVFWDVNLKGGYGVNTSKTNFMTTRNVKLGAFVEPEFGVFLKSNDVLSFGLSISYLFNGIPFGPGDFNLDQLPNVTKEMTNGNLHSFNVGFGFVTMIPTRD